MQAVRFPLYAKVLAWFFLNLLVLAVVAAVALRFQFGSAPERLVSGPAGERLNALSEVIHHELFASPRSEWDQILGRFSTAYSVELRLFRNDGGQVAGTPVTLPPEVLERLVDRRGPGPRGPRGRRDGPEMDDLSPPPGPVERPGRRPDRFDEAGVDDPLDGPRRERRLRQDGPVRVAPPRGIRFALKTDEPKRYWVGLPMPVPTPAPDRPPMGGTLLLSTGSIRAGGLLLDLSGWTWIAAGSLLFSVLFWLPMVRHITRPIFQMRGAAEQIAEGRFDVRVGETRRDELGSLGSAINRMAQRLNGFVTGQKRFMGDIAHELCSPLARMQMALGILEERATDKEASYVQDVKEEVEQMSGLVNELLSFSKASLASSQIRLGPVPLRPVVERAITRERHDGVDIRNEVPEQTCAQGDPELLVRAVSNLLRNAVRYAGDAGPITVTAKETDGSVELAIIDSGPGVPEQELPKLFDPFYRVDTARARETGGTGLGLSIVKTCVESCRGTVTCRNREPGGFEVTIRLHTVTDQNP